MNSGTSFFNESAPCEACGCFGAYEFDGHRLCASCYETRGSCCPEFGRDDLWRPEVLDGVCPPKELRKRKP